MVIFFVVVCFASGALCIATGDPVYAVPLVCGLVYLAGHAIERRSRPVGRRADPGFERQLKEVQWWMATAGMGAFFLMLTVLFVALEGWRFNALGCATGSLFCLGLWAYRRVQGRAQLTDRGAEPSAAADRADAPRGPSSSGWN